MNILLFDDEAKNGWEEILKILFTEKLGLKINLDSITTKEEGLKILKQKNFDLIFLDLRFGEKDHLSNNIEDFTGFKILESIRKSFNNINFTTPIILFTATNKIWYINKMMEYGVDNYYIKEHPNFSYDINFTKDNYGRLLKSISSLLKENEKRKEIWYLTQSINNYRFQNPNINKRVTEKLKLGYGILFRKERYIEEKTLVFNKEIIAFIVFWSILEEVSKDFFDKNWNNNKDNNWVLRNGEKIQIVTDKKNETRFTSIADEFNIWKPFIISERGYGPSISLSNQICAILRYQLGWGHHQIKSDFLMKLNQYRNKNDFIHSSVDSIFNQSLKDNQDSIAAYKKCVQVLEFISTIVNTK